MNPQAQKNPFKQYLELYNSVRKTSYATQYRNFGRLSWIQISQDAKFKIKQALLKIQNACIPVIKELRNQKNVIELQERVYHDLQPYENRFNTCIVQSRTPEQSDYCSDILIKNLTIDFWPQLKKILSEY